jgi:hypothetical protein
VCYICEVAIEGRCGQRPVEDDDHAVCPSYEAVGGSGESFLPRRVPQLHLGCCTRQIWYEHTLHLKVHAHSGEDQRWLLLRGQTSLEEARLPRCAGTKDYDLYRDGLYGRRQAGYILDDALFD